MILPFIHKQKSILIPALTKGAAAGIFTLGSAKLFQFLIKLIISRLGATNLGTYFILTTTYTSVITFASLGIPLGVARYVSYYWGKQNKDKVRSITNAGLTMILLFGGIAGISIVFGSALMAKYTGLPHSEMYFRLLGVGIAGSMMLLVIRQTLFGLLKFRMAYLLENIESVFRLAIIFMLVTVLQYGLIGAVAGYSGAVVCATCIGYAFLKKTLHPYRYGVVFSRELISYTWPVSLSEIITAATGAMTIIMLNMVKGVSDVGYYAAAVSIASLLHVLPQIILAMQFPLITVRFSKNQPVFRQFTFVIVFLASVLVPLCIIVMVFGPFIIRWLLGSVFTASENILFWLAPAYALYAIFVWPARQLLDMAGLTKTNLLLTIIRSCIVIISALFLLPLLGGSGLAIALLSGWGIEGILCLFYVKQKTLLYHHDL